MNAPEPDFSSWDTGRLLRQRRHLEAILAVSAGQHDRLRPQLRAEHQDVCTEITRRTQARTTRALGNRAHVRKAWRQREPDLARAVENELTRYLTGASS